MQNPYAGMRATKLIPKEETQEEKTCVDKEVKRRPYEKNNKSYTQKECLKDTFRFLIESGILRPIKYADPYLSEEKCVPFDLLGGWESEFFEFMKDKGFGQNIKRVHSDKSTLAGLFEIKIGEKAQKVTPSLLRNVVAATLREQLPPEYKGFNKEPTYPDIAKIVGYSAHPSAIYAHRRYEEQIIKTIDEMNSLLEQ